MRFLIAGLVAFALAAHEGPNTGAGFKGRIAWSSDGNHNDEDDWAASPLALAIFSRFGVQEKLVHFDYNCIVRDTDPAWEKEHERSVLGGAERWGFDRARFHDCRKNLEAVVNSIARAINESSAENPLYWVLAGPMEVPLMGIKKSDPAKRKFVYTISHSRWNDGYGTRYGKVETKRAVIPGGVHWIQIQDQNQRLKTSPYGRPGLPEEFAPWHWMRDAGEERVRFLWERLLASRRADASDAGMAYFLMTGDEEADVETVRRLVAGGEKPALKQPRAYVRLEVENFLKLDGFDVEDTDRGASHRLNARLERGRARAVIPFDEPYTAARAGYVWEVRHAGECRFMAARNGKRVGEAWKGTGSAWSVERLGTAVVAAGDELSVEAEGSGCRVDYLHLTLKP